MTDLSLTCPYCNATVTLPSSVGPGRRVRCPRCEESFSVRGSDEDPLTAGDPQSADLPPMSLAGPSAQPEPPSRRWSNLSVAAAILGVMALMALIGFSWAWLTTEARRKRDQLAPPGGTEAVRTVVVAPAKLPALGYLPSDVNVLAGLHVAELLAERSGRELFLSPRDATGVPHLDRLEQWTGLKLDTINHVVLGVRTEERLVPRITLVVQTRQAFDADQVRTALKAGRRSERAKRTLYRFTPGQSSLELTLWFAGDRTLVVGLIPEDFDDVPLVPAAGVDRFAEPLRQLLAQRTGEGTQLWAFAHARDWQHALAFQSLPGLPSLPFGDAGPADQPLLANVQALGLWLQLGSSVAANLAVGCNDRATAGRWAQVLQRKGDDNLLPRGHSTLPWLWRTEDTWVSGRAEASAGAFRQALTSPQD
jgi:hypothetical protein